MAKRCYRLSCDCFRALHKGAGIVVINGTHVIGAVGGVVLAVGIGTVDDAINPGPLMSVESIRYENERVVFERTVDEDHIAVASVVIVKDYGLGEPACIGSGIWTYTTGEQTTRTYTVDEFANAACALEPGSYTAFATWTPMNGGVAVSANVKIRIGDNS